MTTIRAVSCYWKRQIVMSALLLCLSQDERKKAVTSPFVNRASMKLTYITRPLFARRWPRGLWFPLATDRTYIKATNRTYIKATDRTYIKATDRTYIKATDRTYIKATNRTYIKATDRTHKKVTDRTYTMQSYDRDRKWLPAFRVIIIGFCYTSTIGQAP